LKKLLLHIIIIVTSLNIVTLNQFSKLPVLLVHYTEHQEQNSKITLLEFLSMHYWGADIKDNDDKKDKQLPFKSLSSSNLLSFTQPVQFSIRLRLPIIIAEPKRSVYAPAFVPNEVSSSLLRPPIV
jgi:hypothetical protein